MQSHAIKHAALAFLTAVLTHVVTVPIELGAIGEFLLGKHIAHPNTTYVYDDVPAIEKNRWVIDASTEWQELFKSRDFWGGDLRLTTSHKSYRPLTSLSYRIQVLWSGLGVNSTQLKRNLHFFNVIAFGAVTICFYFVCLAITSNTRPSNLMRSSGLQYSRPSIISAISALVFAVHPVHTEAVACLVGRCEILSGLFFLLSILTYIQSSPLVEDASCESERTSICSVRGLMWHLVAGCLAFASMLSKEQGITVIGVWVICDAYHVALLVSRLQSSRAEESSSTAASTNAALWTKFFLDCIAQVPRHVFTLAMFVTMLYYRMWIGGGYAPIVFSRAENPAAKSEEALTRALSFFYINMLNFWILIFPKDLCVDWALGSIPLVESLMDARLLLPISMLFGIFVILSILSGAISLSYDHKSGRDGIVVPMHISFFNSSFLLAIFGISMMIISFIPASNLFFYVGFVIAERVLFIPSMGFSIFIAAVLESLLARSNRSGESKSLVSEAKRQPGARISTKFVVAGICGSLFVRSVSRNLLWRNDIAFMQANAYTNPRNARILHGLGVALHAAGQEDSAMEKFQLAWDLWPGYNEPMNFIGVLQNKRGNREEALAAYRLALKETPEFTKSLYNIVDILGAVGNENITELDEAVKHLKKLVVCQIQGGEQERAKLLSRIGFLQARTGKFHAASRSLERAVALAASVKGSVPYAAEYLGLMHLANGRVGKAKHHFDIALSTGNTDFLQKREHIIRTRLGSLVSSSLSDVIHGSQVEICQHVKSSVRNLFISTGPRLTFDDPEVRNVLSDKVSIALTVFESEDLSSRVHDFCRDRGWSIEGEHCKSVIATLREEESRMRDKHGITLGNVQYNIDLDNSFTVEFSVDDQMVALDVNPTSDVPTLAKNACIRYNMNLDNDCPKLVEHILERQQSHIQTLIEPLKSWTFDKCDVWAMHKAKLFISQLDEKVDSHFESSPHKKREDFDMTQNSTEVYRSLSILKNASAYSALARWYYGLASQVESDSTNIAVRIRRIRMAAIFAAPIVASLGEKEAMERLSVDWKSILESLIDSNRALQEYNSRKAWWQHPSDIWSKAIEELENNGGKALGVQSNSNIAIVSLCQYDAARTPLAMLSIHNKVTYSQKHGYR